MEGDGFGGRGKGPIEESLEEETSENVGLQEDICVNHSGDSSSGMGKELVPSRVGGVDWTSIITLLGEGDIGVGDSGEHRHLPPADVYVPGSVWYVRIPWTVIFHEIGVKMGLKAHKIGILNEKGPAGGYIAWVDCDVPAFGEQPSKKVQRFYGDEGEFFYDAIQNAYKEIVMHLCTSFSVVVKDVNYDDMVVLKEKAKREADFVDLYRDVIKKKEEREAVVKSSYATLISASRKFCEDFKDQLLIDVTDPCQGHGPIGVLYNGRLPPKSRKEKMSFELVALLNKFKASGAGFIAPDLV